MKTEEEKQAKTIQVVMEKSLYQKLIYFITKKALREKSKPETVSLFVKNIIKNFLDGEKG